MDLVEALGARPQRPRDPIGRTDLVAAISDAEAKHPGIPVRAVITEYHQCHNYDGIRHTFPDLLIIEDAATAPATPTDRY
jgi:hypothetical protein